MSENKMYTPSLEEQLVNTGLNMPENWKGDLRPLWVEMFEPLIEGTNYEFSMNERDPSKYVLDLFRKNAKTRCMGFNRAKDGMGFRIFPTRRFYEEIVTKIELPKPDPKKNQPHINLTCAQMWELMCAITREIP